MLLHRFVGNMLIFLILSVLNNRINYILVIVVLYLTRNLIFVHYQNLYCNFLFQNALLFNCDSFEIFEESKNKNVTEKTSTLF